MTALAIGFAFAAQGCAASASSDGSAGDEEQSDDALFGAQEARFLAAGYLAPAAGEAKVLCGATLVGPGVVVTAAHCAYRNREGALAFGYGPLGQTRVAVREIHYHPKAHVEQDGMIDLVHALRLDDLAYLVLERPIASREVTPAAIPKQSPKWAGCDVRLLGYGAGAGGRIERKATDGCVVLKPEIGDDAIIEIHPRSGGAVCHGDGDEGHAALAIGDDGLAALVGVYVGSVTQKLTDCKDQAQFLNGYEDVAGHADFFEEAIRRGLEVHGTR